MTKTIEEYAPKILEAIKKSNSILLHCHPFPDPDSVGSVLATKFAIQELFPGKSVTIIRGDTDRTGHFSHFPGFSSIVQKSFGEIDIKDFDLFLIIDSSSADRISEKAAPKFPLPIQSIVIDHHISNTMFADMNCVDASYPASSQILYDLFTLWGVKLTYEIAANLFIGIYTDTGGFKYSSTTGETLEIASKLVSVAEDFPKIIFELENNHTKQYLMFKALALTSLKSYYNDRFAITNVSFEDLSKCQIGLEDLSPGSIAHNIISVKDFVIGASFVESSPNSVGVSFRTRDSEKYDVSKIATAFGGGGHKGAAGVRLNMPLKQAIENVVEKAGVIYNF